MKELETAGRAIAAPDLRTAWLAALRADLRRAVRNMLAVGGWRMAVVKRCSIFGDVLVEALSVRISEMS